LVILPENKTDYDKVFVAYLERAKDHNAGKTIELFTYEDGSISIEALSLNESPVVISRFDGKQQFLDFLSTIQ